MNRETRFLLSLPLVAISLLASACAMGPDYKRPAVPAPEQFRGAPAGQAASGALTDRPWWEIFDDGELGSLIDEALRNNYDIRAAAWRVEEFRARAGIAPSELYPQVGYQAGWSRSRES